MGYGYGYGYPFLREDAAGVTYLYDNYAFSGGWGVRALNGNNYSGGLVTIRRSSDNAEKTFYPDTNGELSMNSEDGASTSLSSWITSDSGFVKTIFDQSGSAYDFSQTTAANQARIVNAGSLNTLNTKAAMEFFWDGVNISQYTATMANNQPITGWFVGSFDTFSGSRFVVWDNSSSKRLFSNTSNGYPETHFGANLFGSTAMSTGTQYLVYSLANTTSSANGFNGSTYASGDAGSNNPATTLYLGINGTRKLDGDFQELLIYFSDQSSNRTGIESDVNGHYSIY